MRLGSAWWASLARREAQGVGSRLAVLIERQGQWLLPSVLALVTLVAFLPALDNGFLAWDDNRNLVENPYYRGLGWVQLRWMLTTFRMGHYIPLTWMTFGLDYLFWGMNPVGYHLTNILLHMANTAVFYAIAVRLLVAALPAVADGVAEKLGGAAAALLFAVHPLRVESVAWATERRDLLCGFFYLLAILAYLGACGGADVEERARRRRYWGAVGLTALALLSKSMAVSLPVVLLVLDVYPLRRLGGGRERWFGEAVRRVWMEKAPFVLLSAAASAMALVALAHGSGGIVSMAQIGWPGRVAISVYSLAFYLRKMVWPVHLSALYALPTRIVPLRWPYVEAGVVTVAMSVAAVLLLWRWRRPGLGAVWVSYIVILLPVLGIVQNGPQIAADRYTYLAEMGWAVLVGAWAGRWCADAPDRLIQGRRAMALVGTGAAVAVVLGTLTWRQAEVWYDDGSLWAHALSTSPSAVAYSNLGVVLGEQGELEEAMKHLRRAVAMNPNYADAQNNLGNALALQGRLDEAVTHYREALSLNPNYADAHNNLGNALALRGQLDEAVHHLQKALDINPSYAEAHNNLGLVLARQGQLSEAMRHYQAALNINPSYAEAHNNLGKVLLLQDRQREAIEHFRRAISLRPDLRDAQRSLDSALSR